jgi:CheY-like chemotaxis protein
MTPGTPPRSSGPSSGTPGTRAEEVARLTGELFHDLNDGLLTLSALADFAAAEASEGRSASNSIGQIRELCRHLRQGVRDISESIHGRSPPPDVDFDPCAVARSAHEHWLITTPTLDNSMRCDVPAGTRVRGRASYLYRAVLNLLRNAGRHARREVQMRVRLVEGATGPVVEITVEDDGPGVPPELIENIFEPYVGAAPGGTGLGLSVVSFAMRELGGTVELMDEASLGGARFTLALPATRASRGSAAREESRPATALRGRRIAVIDDNPAIRRMFARLLAHEGAVAIEFVPADYPAADSLALELANADLDLILLDVEMGPFNGLIVWRTLQQRAPAAADRVLFLSGYVYDSVEAVPALAERWVTKEGTWEAIRQAIVNQLEKL